MKTRFRTSSPKAKPQVGEIEKLFFKGTAKPEGEACAGIKSLFTFSRFLGT